MKRGPCMPPVLTHLCVKWSKSGVGAEYLATNCECSQRNVQQSGSAVKPAYWQYTRALWDQCTVLQSLLFHHPVCFLTKEELHTTYSPMSENRSNYVAQGYTSFRILKTEATKQRQQQKKKKKRIATTLKGKAGFASHDLIWSVIQHCKNVAACCCICQTELSQLSQYEAPRAGELCAALFYPS